MPSVKAKRLRPRNRPAGAVGRLPDAAPGEIIAHMTAAFLVRDVPALRKRVFRLGLSGSFGLDEAGLARGARARPVRLLDARA